MDRRPLLSSPHYIPAPRPVPNIASSSCPKPLLHPPLVRRLQTAVMHLPGRTSLRTRISIPLATEACLLRFPLITQSVHHLYTLCTSLRGLSALYAYSMTSGAGLARAHQARCARANRIISRLAAVAEQDSCARTRKVYCIAWVHSCPSKRDANESPPTLSCGCSLELESEFIETPQILPKPTVCTYGVIGAGGRLHC